MKTLAIGGIRIQTYGLALALGICCALVLFLRGSRQKRGAEKEGFSASLSLFALLAIPLGFLCGRLSQALISQGWYLFRQDFLFNFSRGGYLLYGVMAGIVLAAWMTSRISHRSFPALLDRIAAPGLLLIAVCRFAEGLIGCGYGRSIAEWFDPMLEQNMITLEDPSFFLRFPFGIPNYYGEMCWSIFLLEGISALLFLRIVTKQRSVAPSGVFLLALLLYAGAQTWLESLRADSLPRWGFVRVNQLLSGIAAAGVLTLCSLRCLRHGGSWPWGSWAGMLGCVGLIIAMEFAVEGKIAFLQWMKMDLCYGVMGLGSLGLILCIRPVWKAACISPATKTP